MIASHHLIGVGFVAGCILVGVGLSATSGTHDPGQTAGPIIRVDLRAVSYADFRSKVAEGTVADVIISGDKIDGHFNNGDEFNTQAIAGDTTLEALLAENGVRFRRAK
jgi:hypothetical protein